MSIGLKPLTPEHRVWRWKILTTTYIAYIGYYMTRKIFTICKTTIAAELGWELGDTAYVWASFLIAYMIGQFLNSFIGRKWGPRVILLGGLGISIICNTIFGFTNSFANFLLFMFINGLAQASGWPGCIGGISRWLRNQERGTVMGIWTTNHIIANIIYKSLGGLLLGMFGWRWAFFGMSILTLFVWALILIWQKDRPEDVGLEPIIDKTDDYGQAIKASQEEHIPFSEYLRVAFNPLIFIMGIAYFSVKFLRYALDSWLPSFLNIQGLPVDQASYYSMVFDVTGVVGTIFAGYILDRWFRGNWAGVCFLCGLGTILGYIAVIYAGANPIMIAMCFGIVGFMLYGPDSLLTGAAAVAVAGEANAVAITGIINGIGSVGPVIQELVIGKFMKTADPMVGIARTNTLCLIFSIALAVSTAFLTWYLYHIHQRNSEDNNSPSC
ncbi:MAG TPA: MFS transporter [Candidatus Hydrogenedens sp.]|nr:MFS transporter [Candidatus Hydrogenedens sp.]HOL18774.1 MFS transporter [Candidatus Hydrogenedens sp.]HPP59074.1 MFS transporter [Candidatus Hydrogenedens sp.]